MLNESKLFGNQNDQRLVIEKREMDRGVMIALTLGFGLYKT